MQLTHCIYTSQAARFFETLELAELLQTARKNNRAIGLTGMLLYAEGDFFQVLEGPSDVVDRVINRIELDKRHDQMTQIIREPISKRAFEEWTMGFSRVSRPELAALSGANDFFRTRLTELKIGRAKKLLSAFAEGRWRKTITEPDNVNSVAIA